MNLTTEQIKEAALSLPPDDRESIVEALLVSLRDAELDDEWDEEAERRYQAYLAGEMEGFPADRVIAEARARRR